MELQSYQTQQEARPVETKSGYLQFERLIEHVEQDTRITRWKQVEGKFLTAALALDAARGDAPRDADLHQELSSHLNQLLLLLLQNSTGRALGNCVRCGSDLSSESEVDLCYPERGDAPIAGAAVSVLDAPKLAGGDHARPARSKLQTRVREVAWAAFDFKSHYAAPQPIQSFKSWVQQTRPRYYSFWALRCTDESSFVGAREAMNGLRDYCNGVGALFYGPSGTSYTAAAAPELTIDRALHEMTAAILSNDGKVVERPSL